MTTRNSRSALSVSPWQIEISRSQAGNFYLVQGDTDRRCAEFRVVMESDPYCLRLPGKTLLASQARY